MAEVTPPVIPEARLQAVLDTLEEMAGGELDRRLDISPAHDLLDAIAYSVNILAGELGYAGELRNAFLRNVSHELRTPVTAIVNLSELLATNAPATDSGDVAKRILRNAQSLLRLVNGLLDLSRLDAGHFDVALELVALPALVADVVHAFEPAAAAKGLRLSIEHKAAPSLVYTDAQRVGQILTNLVSNAVKFTTRGEVRIVVGTLLNELCVEVVDTGVGIAPEEHSRLFVAFSRARNHSPSDDGAGLGLELSRRLAQRLDGDLRLVESEVGAGSRFRLTLPLRASESRAPASEVAAPEPVKTTSPRAVLQGMRVLVAEDNEDTHFALQELLSLAGCQVTIAADGIAAYEQAIASPFDVVLMDIQMPGIDGLEATRRLRKAGYPGVVIALTADAGREQKQRCLDAGCDEHVAKPIEFERLAGYILRTRRGKTPPQ